MHIHQVGMTRAHYTPGNANRIRMVVLHATAGRYPGDYTWLRNGGGQTRNMWVSIHYYIDKQGTISQMVADHNIAWHAGRSTWTVDGRAIDYNIGCNPVSLGIKLENRNTGHDPYPEAQYAAALWLTRRLVEQYAIPRSQIVRHLDIAPRRKTDPAGFAWERFLNELEGPASQPYTARPYVTVTDEVPIYEVPDRSSSIAWNGKAILGLGNVFTGIDQSNGFVWHTGGIGFVESSLVRPVEESGEPPVQPPPDDIITPDTPLRGSARATLAQCRAYITSRPHGAYKRFDIDAILNRYTELSIKVGLDPLLVIAQMIHETGNLSSWWSARPRRNPAGIGVTGTTQSKRPHRDAHLWHWNGRAYAYGLSFPTWHDHAIPAHIGRLLRYVLPTSDGDKPVAPTSEQQMLMEQALRYRNLPRAYWGSSQTLRDLALRWSLDGQYADNIARIANAIRATAL